MAKVEKSNQDRTISLKDAVRSCINKLNEAMQIRPMAGGNDSTRGSPSISVYCFVLSDL